MGFGTINNRNIGMGVATADAFTSYFNSRAEAEAQADQIIAQAKQAIKSMNYTLQNYDLERKDAYDQAVTQLGAIRLQARGIEASVANATAEQQGDSKTAKLLNRTIKADGLRTMTQTKQNYQRKSNEIDLNKEQSYLSTKSYLDNLETPRVPNIIGGIFNNTGKILEAYNGYENIQNTKDTRVGTKYIKPSEVNNTPSVSYNSRELFNGNTFKGFTDNTYRFGVLQGTSNEPLSLNYDRPSVFTTNLRWSNTI